MTEDHPIKPVCPYGLTKWVGEQYFDLLGMDDVCILRYANVYGLGCRGIVAAFKDCVENNKSPIMYGTGDDTTRDYIHIKDVVGANRYALKGDLKGVYNVSTGISTTPKQLWNVMSEVYPNDIPVIYEDFREGECVNNVLSSEKLQRMGWELTVGLKDGLLDI